jgi:hypothetical protein
VLGGTVPFFPVRTTFLTLTHARFVFMVKSEESDRKLVEQKKAGSVSAKQWLFVVVLCVLAAGLVLAGFFVGRYSVIRVFRAEIRTLAFAETLGKVMTEKQRKGVENAYYDTASARKKLDDISWGVPNSPAPYVGHVPTPGVHNNAHINAMQFRADHEIALPKPKGVYRIFFTGGSTAFGSGAANEDSTIAAYLERLLAKNLTPKTNKTYEVITAANPAWASTHERVFIENRLSEMQPDMVISFSGNNDVHWGEHGDNVLWFRSYYDELFFRLIKRAYTFVGEQPPPDVTKIQRQRIAPDVVASRLLKNVKISSYVLAQTGVQYVFVLQPTLAASAKRLTPREQAFLTNQNYFRDCYTKMDEALRRLQSENYYYVNLTGIFDRLDDRQDIFIDSYHFGDKGNDMIAQQIFSHLAERLFRF